MHHYQAYGCHIASTIYLPELVIASDSTPVDIQIREEAITPCFPTPEPEGDYFDTNPDRVLLRVSGVGRFLIQQGNEILIEPDKNGLASDVRLYLLGTCFGALLHQRGILALHASAIATEHGAVLFMGPSGSGKSTMLRAFVERGYKMLADDVTGISFDENNTPLVLPAFPRTKLWADSATYFNHDLTQLERVRPQEDKYHVFFKNHFSNVTNPLFKIYVLSSKNVDSIDIQRVPKLKSFSTILENIYQEQLNCSQQSVAHHFRAISGLTSNISVTQMSRNMSSFHIRKTVQILEEDFIKT
jgi:hypothetical protein